jgi:heme O synthase-like polyprenyltransferase
LFSFFAQTGRLYLVPAVILGIGFYHFASQLALSRSRQGAKRLLHASVIYLPLLYLFMLIDRML